MPEAALENSLEAAEFEVAFEAASLLELYFEADRSQADCSSLRTQRSGTRCSLSWLSGSLSESVFLNLVEDHSFLKLERFQNRSAARLA